MYQVCTDQIQRNIHFEGDLGRHGDNASVPLLVNSLDGWTCWMSRRLFGRPTSCMVREHNSIPTNPPTQLLEDINGANVCVNLTVTDDISGENMG